MIYIFDDEADLLTSMCKRLRLRGYEVTGISSPSLALQTLAQSHTNCEMILVDYTMPGQASDRKLWQELQVFSAAPIYVITGYGQGYPEMENLAALKVAGIFYKPVPFDELMLIIASLGIQKKPSRKT